MDDLLTTLAQATGTAVPASAAPSAASPGSVPDSFDPTKSYGTPPQLLDNLRSEESSGNPYAVNPKTQAMGPYQFEPSTVAMLRKQGIAFDPFDPQQSRAAADYYIQQLKQQNGGTYEGALKAYGGFKTADPSAYVSKAMQGVPPAPTTPGQSNSGEQPSGYSGPTTDLLSTLQSAMNAPQAAATAPAAQQSGQQPVAGGFLAGLGRSAAGLADTVLSAPGALAQQGTYALARASGMTPEEATAQAAQFSGAVHPVGNAFGVTNTPEYQNEVTQRAQQAIGGLVNRGASAVAGAAGLPAQDVANMAGSLAMAAPGAIRAGVPLAGQAIEAVVPGAAHLASQIPGAVAGAARGAAGAVGNAARAVGETASDFGNAVGTVTGLKAPEEPALTNAPLAAAGTPGRGSVGAAGTSFAQQAAAEGVPNAIIHKIADAEKAGNLNPTAAARHIEAGSLPIPMELTEGMASGNPITFSNEMNTRGKNPDYVLRLNTLNGQLVDNLNAVKDQISPNVHVMPGTGTGQAIVDAYKQMDAPIQQQISDLYARAHGADGAPALVDSAPQMQNFASQIGPTRFNALPANVQQIFRDAIANQVSLPPGFEVNGSNVRPMNVSDLMDIDKTLSGAMRSASDGSVRHDIGALRDAIINSQLNPSSAGADAFAAYKTAQASARARFQAIDADPAYKAAVNDITPVGEPSPLADDFAKKYIAGGKTANVQNMMQNLSNDPVNKEIIGAALMDYIKQRSGIDLVNDSGNVAQASLNKTLRQLGDKTTIVLGPEAGQTVEKIGNVARYTQEQQRGSFVNNSNTAVAQVANAAKSAIEGAANVVAHGIPVGTWARGALANRANAKDVARTLEPGAGMTSVPLNQLLKKSKGNP